jgi:hypothetical protein
MSCPFLEYRRETGDQAFDVARAYCTAAGEFVQPMRADICNDRYDLQHDEDCEIHRAHADGGENGASRVEGAGGDS